MYSNDANDNVSTAAGAVHHSSVVGVQVSRQTAYGLKSAPDVQNEQWSQNQPLWYGKPNVR